MREVAEGPAGRALAFERSGLRTGRPVFLLHGTPGILDGPRPRGIFLYRLGVCLICYTRPGYPGSDRALGRRVADAAADVEAIANHLEIDTFSVIGRSGGAPHALACADAAALRGRVICAAALGSLAPINAPDLAWYDGMTEANVRAYQTVSEPPTAERDLKQLIKEFEEQAERLRVNSQELLGSLSLVMGEEDRQIIGDVGLRRIIARAQAAALSKSVDGWVDDVVALGSPWGFEPSDIKVPVLLWHGLKDRFSPVSHARWLAKAIPAAELREEPSVAHFSAVEVLPEILNWVFDQE